MLFVAIVLDPRYKLDALEFWLNDNYKDEDEVVTPIFKQISFKPFQICGSIFVHYGRPINI